MAKILIACPVFKREWILPTWLEFIENQDFPKENLGFMFELGDDDEATHDILWDWQCSHPQYHIFDGQIDQRLYHEAHPDGTRQWHSERYETMATLRNSLLERASQMTDRYDYYFSLDSDILLEDPQTLNKLVAHAEAISDADVLSPLMYMTPFDTDYPSAMTWVDHPGGRAIRDLGEYKIGEVFKADIVMAAVFMKQHVVERVRYRWHPQGEDLGFAAELARMNMSSYCVWDVYCPHIMHSFMLSDYLSTHIDGRKPF